MSEAFASRIFAPSADYVGEDLSDDALARRRVGVPVAVDSVAFVWRYRTRMRICSITCPIISKGLGVFYLEA